MKIMNWIKYELMGLPSGAYILKIGDKKGSVSFPVNEFIIRYLERHPKAKIIGIEINEGLKND